MSRIGPSWMDRQGVAYHGVQVLSLPRGDVSRRRLRFNRDRLSLYRPHAPSLRAPPYLFATLAQVPTDFLGIILLECAAIFGIYFRNGQFTQSARTLAMPTAFQPGAFPNPQGGNE